MIDIEEKVFKKISAAIASASKQKIISPTVVLNDYTSIPAKFPAVLFVQYDNPVHEQSRDLSNSENAVYPMFTASIFSNLQTTTDNNKKTQAKKIAAVIADTMNSLGFTRTFDQPVPNADDATIYRIEQRYRKVVGRGDMR